MEGGSEVCHSSIDAKKNKEGKSVMMEEDEERTTRRRRRSHHQSAKRKGIRRRGEKRAQEGASQSTRKGGEGGVSHMIASSHIPTVDTQCLRPCIVRAHTHTHKTNRYICRCTYRHAYLYTYCHGMTFFFDDKTLRRERERKGNVDGERSHLHMVQMCTVDRSV